MKKLILIVIMVLMVDTPCMAQEVEPEGIFSIEGTKWSLCTIVAGLYNFVYPIVSPYCTEWGFYQDTLYYCSEDSCSPSPFSYIDTPVVGIVLFFNIASGCRNCIVGYAIIQPSGIGIYTAFAWGQGFSVGGFAYSVGILFKTEDNWTPPSE